MALAKRKSKAWYKKKEYDAIKAKENYLINFSGKMREHFISKANKRLKSIRTQLKRFRQREAFITKLYDIVIEYLDQDPMSGFNIARMVFFKYGLEHGVNGRDLRDFLGVKDVHAPSRIRRQVILTEDRREIYKSFLTFVINNNGDEIFLKKVY